MRPWEGQTTQTSSASPSPALVNFIDLCLIALLSLLFLPFWQEKSSRAPFVTWIPSDMYRCLSGPSAQNPEVRQKSCKRSEKSRPFLDFCKTFRDFQDFRDFCKTFSRLFQDFFKTFSRLFQDFFKTFSRLFQDFPRLFKTFQDFLRLFQDSLKTFSRLCQEIFETFSRLFQDFSRLFSNLSQDSFKTLQENFETFSRLFQDICKSFQDFCQSFQFQDLSRLLQYYSTTLWGLLTTFVRLSQDFCKTFSRLFHDVFKTFYIIEKEVAPHVSQTSVLARSLGIILYQMVYGCTPLAHLESSILVACTHVFRQLIDSIKGVLEWHWLSKLHQAMLASKMGKKCCFCISEGKEVGLKNRPLWIVKNEESSLKIQGSVFGNTISPLLVRVWLMCPL